MDQLIDDDAHAALLEKLRAGATAFRAKGEEPVEELNFADDSVRSSARVDAPIPHAAVLGRQRDSGRPRRGLSPPRHARPVQAALGRQGRQRRGLAEAARRGLPPAAGAHVERADLPAPARAARLLPLLLGWQRHRRARSRGPHDGAHALRLSAPAEGRPNLPRRLLPPGGGRGGQAFGRRFTTQPSST